MTKKILAFKPFAKAIVTEPNHNHCFNINEEVYYVETIKNFDGTKDWHKFQTKEGGLFDYLVDGEFEIVNDKKLRGVELEGCDATTPFNMEMTDEEFEFLKRVADLSKMYSRYGCMPVMNLSEKPIELYDEEDED
jgi:hypothetical protein